jgi:muramidase (phage lysozyme)
MLNWKVLLALSGLASVLLPGCGGPDLADQDSESLAAVKGTVSLERVRELVSPTITRQPFAHHGVSVAVAIGVVRFDGLPGWTQNWGLTPQLAAFLDVIAAAEGTSIIGKCDAAKSGGYAAVQGCYMISDAEYNSKPMNMRPFWVTDFAKHPRRLLAASDAAGRYQFISPTWSGSVANNSFISELTSQISRYLPNLGIIGFGPLMQDLGAYSLIRFKRSADRKVQALSLADNNALTAETKRAPNEFRDLLNALSQEWASLPMWNGRSYYGQPVQNADALWQVYQSAYWLYKDKLSADNVASSSGPSQGGESSLASELFTGLGETTDEPVLALK